MDDSLLSRITGADPITRREALLRVARLAGGTLSAAILGGLASRALAGEPAAGGLFAPRREMLAAIVDHILPETDTPGASALGVHDFVATLWEECFPADQQQAFLAGLEELDARAEAAHGAMFLACSEEAQRAILSTIDAETFSPAPAPPQPGRTQPEGSSVEDRAAAAVRWRWGEPSSSATLPFWPTLKRLTLVGYYTSEVGATEELRYEALPGYYDGCVPLSEIGRTWAV